MVCLSWSRSLVGFSDSNYVKISSDTFKTVAEENPWNYLCIKTICVCFFMVSFIWVCLSWMPAIMLKLFLIILMDLPSCIITENITVILHIKYPRKGHIHLNLQRLGIWGIMFAVVGSGRSFWREITRRKGPKTFLGQEHLPLTGFICLARRLHSACKCF